MNATLDTSSARPVHNLEKASTLALRLAHAENALLAFSCGQVDSIVDPGGKIYLLRPAQENLRQNERRLLAVIESTGDVLVVVNRGGFITAQSSASLRVLGYEPAEMIGHSIFELIRDDHLAAVYSAFFNVIEGFQEHADTSFAHRAPDGSHRLIEATLGKLRDGSTEGLVFSLRPMRTSFGPGTEAARDEQVSAPPSLGKDRFIAVLAHELRTPLSPALLGLEDLQEDERFTEARPVLTMIRRNIELQSRMLEELTDFTMVGQKKMRVHLEPIDAHESARFVLEICQSEIAAKAVEVLLDLRAAERFVTADPVRLQQVMWNLVKNAVKFSVAGGRISIVTANDPPGYLTIEVADHGAGISADLLPRIFDPFQQGDLAMQQRHGGLGLGLFIAKGLAEAQEGTLTGASAGLGSGATFKLTLHLAPALEL